MLCLSNILIFDVHHTALHWPATYLAGVGTLCQSHIVIAKTTIVNGCPRGSHVLTAAEQHNKIEELNKTRARHLEPLVPPLWSAIPF